ncbi:hypothetical protein FXN63_13680 [Pigmentiphaga aceris]|uniref:Uncharacterized protein n=1 Tax=Pigmentiphaga aceris TaxID=1940612 RepID=A0A5C0AYV6_9BURK|nr:hypothetical protein [Pigmentiphaga aceris]QEI06764.1 hypothetical protein FXN63_13680 [Pigmentiphaga aceris]
MKLRAVAMLCASLATPSAFAMSCISDINQFDFIKTSPQQFYYGTEEKVRNIYDKWATEVKDPARFDRTTIFLAKGDLQHLFTAYCKDEKCTGMDFMKGLQNCSANGPPSQDPICRPVAVVYNKKAYCLLAPGLDNYSSQKPYREFVPFSKPGQ